MVPQSDSPPKPLGATVPHSSLCRWKWAQKLKPLLLHSSEALDAYFWVRGFLGVDQHNHQKKSKILENRLNRLAGYENQTVLIQIRSFFSINLNARHVNGMTPFDSKIGTVIRYDFRMIMCIWNGDPFFSILLPWPRFCYDLSWNRDLVIMHDWKRGKAVYPPPGSLP